MVAAIHHAYFVRPYLVAPPATKYNNPRLRRLGLGNSTPARRMPRHRTQVLTMPGPLAQSWRARAAPSCKGQRHPSPGGGTTRLTMSAGAFCSQLASCDLFGRAYHPADDLQFALLCRTCSGARRVYAGHPPARVRWGRRPHWLQVANITWCILRTCLMLSVIGMAPSANAKCLIYSALSPQCAGRRLRLA